MKCRHKRVRSRAVRDKSSFDTRMKRGKIPESLRFVVVAYKDPIENENRTR